MNRYWTLPGNAGVLAGSRKFKNAGETPALPGSYSSARKAAIGLLCVIVAVAAVRADEAAVSAGSPPMVNTDGFTNTPFLPPGTWHVHDPNRPQPPVVTPGTFSSDREPGKPPADAIVLFNGSDVSSWRDKDGKPANWKIENGELIESKGDIFTQQDFGDIQLHLEFCMPPPKGSGQGRGNSGVFLMGRYEVQILDCYQNLTYADGTVGALYGQHPPMANASKPPGTWQVYDILFTAPKFESNGDVKSPAYVTVLLNGVAIQNHESYMGPTGWKLQPHYTAHASTGPISLQDHNNPTRFRNIWVRPLKTDADAKP